MIQFHNVCKRYKHRTVLNQINLEIASGEFFGLVGVNGAGKTTLIKSMLDFCALDGGQIFLLNSPHTDPQARAQLAFLPEQFIPPYYLTGQHFLSYMAQLHGQQLHQKQYQAICQTVDLDSTALQQPVSNYSKGMAQKLGLAACFLSGKQLLILDEPMSGLDPKARAYLKRYLRQLKQQGITLFFSTHLLADVEALCDRMAILHEGQLRFVGTPAACCATFGTADLEQAYLNCIEAEWASL